ncbi:MAG: hypothetical protein M1343_00060 [Chloroflexi bacterium]|nr:hypothetical protein [Chloroflexota bacterium]
MLARRGLVERYDAPQDRRLTLRRITPAGATHYQASRERALAALRQVLARLDPADIPVLEHQLKLLLESMQQPVSVASESDNAV